MPAEVPHGSVYICSHKGCAMRIYISPLACGQALLSSFAMASWRVATARTGSETLFGSTKAEGGVPKGVSVVIAYCSKHGEEHGADYIKETNFTEGWVVAQRCAGYKKAPNCTRFIVRTPDTIMALPNSTRKTWGLGEGRSPDGSPFFEPLCAPCIRKLKQAYRNGRSVA